MRIFFLLDCLFVVGFCGRFVVGCCWVGMFEFGGVLEFCWIVMVELEVLVLCFMVVGLIGWFELCVNGVFLVVVLGVVDVKLIFWVVGVLGDCCGWCWWSVRVGDCVCEGLFEICVVLVVVFVVGILMVGILMVGIEGCWFELLRKFDGENRFLLKFDMWVMSGSWGFVEYCWSCLFILILEFLICVGGWVFEVV